MRLHIVWSIRSFFLAIAQSILLLALTALVSEPVVSQAQNGETERVEAIIKNYLAEHPQEVERIVRDYLAAHPELVQDSLLEFLKKRSLPANANASDEKAATIKANASALFNSPHQVTLGDPQGEVTMVEFFDYNCGYCKRALPDLLVLMKTDPKLRIVLKEFPVLGKGSMEAARVGIAVRMQDPSGSNYLKFHQKLLGGSGVAAKASALAAARELGFDMARLEQDMQNAEVEATLKESWDLAKKIGVSGTPSYVIGENVVVGAVGAEVLREKIQSKRQ